MKTNAITYDTLIVLQEQARQHLYSLPRRKRWLAGVRYGELVKRMNGTGWQCSLILTQVIVLDL